MIIANLGSTVSEFAGIGAALSLFGVPTALSAIVAAVAPKPFNLLVSAPIFTVAEAAEVGARCGAEMLTRVGAP